MRFAQLTRPARAYLLAAYLVAFGLAVLLLPRDAAALETIVSEMFATWPLFVALLLATTLTHSFPVHTPNRQSYYVSLPFFAAAVLLASPLELLAILVVPNLVEWKRQSRSWVAQAFNVAAYVITGLAAQAAYRRSQPFGLAELESLVGEGILLLMGLPLAFLAQAAPWALLPASAPLLLAHRALEMPHMRAERRHDELTGLFTLAYLLEVCDRELNRARRFGRPIVVLFLELRDFETISASYGRQACDALVRKAAQALSDATREYDVAAHVGGGRFAMLLPEADAERATTIARRLQASAATQEVEVPTSLEPLRVSLRVGIAAPESDHDSARTLVEAAE